MYLSVSLCAYSIPIYIKIIFDGFIHIKVTFPFKSQQKLMIHNDAFHLWKRHKHLARLNYFYQFLTQIYWLKRQLLGNTSFIFTTFNISHHLFRYGLNLKQSCTFHCSLMIVISKWNFSWMAFSKLIKCLECFMYCSSVHALKDNKQITSL